MAEQIIVRISLSDKDSSYYVIKGNITKIEEVIENNQVNWFSVFKDDKLYRKINSKNVKAVEYGEIIRIEDREILRVCTRDQEEFNVGEFAKFKNGKCCKIQQTEKGMNLWFRNENNNDYIPHTYLYIREIQDIDYKE